MPGVARTKRAGVTVTHDIREPIIVRPPDPNADITKRVDRMLVGPDTWEQLTDMNVARAGFSIFEYVDDIIAIGGTDGSAIHKSTERYSFADDEWELKASMTTPRAYYQSVMTGGYIYVIGGVTTDGTGNLIISNKVERYDPSNDTWETMNGMPTDYNVAFGVAVSNGSSIFVLSGYRKSLGKLNAAILEYNIGLDDWTIIAEFENDDDLQLYQRILPFFFVNGNDAYIFNGLRYQFDAISEGEGVLLFDAYKFDMSGVAIERSESSFRNLPKARFGGSSVEVGTDAFCIGGINFESNTLRLFDRIDQTTTPFDFEQYTKLTNGRSSFGACSSPTAYGDYIYVAGGVISHADTNFLRVTINAVPETIRLDGKQTGAIDIAVADENGDFPDSVLVRVYTEYASTDGSNAVLMTKDDITLLNGYGMATLLPRAEDVGGVTMLDGSERTYNVRVFGVVIDDTYQGESEAVNLGGGKSGGGGGTSGGGSGVNGINIPDGVIVCKDYKTVVDSNQNTTGSILNLGFLSGFLSFKPIGTTGKSATIQWKSDIEWVPLVKPIIDSNEGTYEDMLDAIDRMSRQEPFGGTVLLDAAHDAGAIIELDTTTSPKHLLIYSDGEENCSHYTEEEVIAQFEAAQPGRKIPTVSACVRVVPDSMHLDKSIRDGSPTLEQLALDTAGSVMYVVNEGNIPSYVASLIIAKGFLGYGVFTFQVDLGEECRIESLDGLFDVDGLETSAFFRYSIGNEDHEFTPYSDRVVANDLVTLQETEGRYVRFLVEFFAAMEVSPYVATVLEPPRMESMEIIYHKKTTSYIYLNKEEPDYAPHQVVVTFDAVRGRGSELTVGTNTQFTGTWEDYSSPSQPAMDNSSKIVIPIRQPVGNDVTYTLESLEPIDGFIFQAKYGKWANDSDVAVYTSQGELVAAEEYRAFPHKGFVVFNRKRTEDLIISITNQPVVSVAAEVINRVNGEPLKIYGGGFMYSTLQPRRLSQTGTVLPEAINLLLIPLKPVVGSTFVANYTYYDVKGRPEKGTVIKWYINDAEQVDLQDLRQWSNPQWQLAVANDVIYFTVQPKNAQSTGRVVRSIPVRLG